MNVKTLYGDVQVKLQGGIGSNEVKSLSNYGINHLPPNDGRKGTHYVKFRVNVPKSLNKDERSLYEQLMTEEERSLQK